MYWCRYLYFTTRGEKIYINQVRNPSKIKDFKNFIKKISTRGLTLLIGGGMLCTDKN